MIGTKGSIVGFVSRSGFFPAFVVLVVCRENGFCAVYPSGDERLIKDVKNLEDLRKTKNFFFLPVEREFTQGEVAVALGAESCFIGTPIKVIESLLMEICAHQQREE